MASWIRVYVWTSKEEGKMKNKKGFFLARWFKRAFMGNDHEVRDIMAEEQVQTPFRTMVRNFLGKRTVRVGIFERLESIPTDGLGIFERPKTASLAERTLSKA